MSHRLAQINEQLKRELAVLIARNLPLEDGLITITTVNCSPDLRYAKIFISVLPENKTGQALKNLRRHNAPFSDNLKKKLRLKFIPKFNWRVDENERYAVEIEKAFKELENEEENEDYESRIA